MDGATWFISIFVGVIAVIGLGVSFVPVYGRWRAYQQSSYLRLDLPSRLQQAVSARLMARERGGIIGALVVGGATVLAFSTGAIDIDPTLTVLFLIGAVFAGVGLGTATAALTGKKQVPSDRPRVARSGVATVADYIAPIERVGAWVVVAIAVVLAVVVAVAQPASGRLLVPTVLFAVTAALALLLFEVASRRIVDASQPAGSTAEMIWDDALRSSAIRDLVTAPLALAVYGTVFAVFSLADQGVGATAVAGYIGSGFAIAALVTTLLASVVSRPRRYFLARLWPDLRWSDTAETTADAV